VADSNRFQQEREIAGMAITSPGQLQQELGQMRSLDPADIADIMQYAHFSASGVLDGIYARPLVAKATPPEIRQFLTTAGAHHPTYGGAIGGDEVRPDAYPTGRGSNPCVARDNFWCWAG
jgi:hypothetical protein